MAAASLGGSGGLGRHMDERARSVSVSETTAHADLTLGISLGCAYQSFLLPSASGTDSLASAITDPRYASDSLCRRSGGLVVASWGGMRRYRGKGISTTLDQLVVSQTLVSLFLQGMSMEPTLFERGPLWPSKYLILGAQVDI